MGMPERESKKRFVSLAFPVFIGCAGCFGVLLSLIGVMLALLSLTVGGVRGGVLGKVVGVIKVEGILADADGTGMVSSEAVTKLLERAREDSSIRAVVMRINSPGGSASVAQEIYQAIMEFKKSGKPIVASMGEVAASGGFYIASATDFIFASPSTLTGSIGAIFATINFEGLMRKIGVEAETITSGPFKDTGSGLRKLRPEERKLLKQMIDDVYEQFLSDVARGRKLQVSQIRPIADGRILTGRQALKFKLVDKLGGLQEAISFAAERAGIKGKPRVRELRYRRSLWEVMDFKPTPFDFKSMLLIDLRLCPNWLLRNAVRELAIDVVRAR
jgi:protease-4